MLTLIAALLSCALFETPDPKDTGSDCTAEACNGLDDDCDGDIDEDVASPPAWYADDDGDLYGDSAESTEGCEAPAGFVADGSDCNDADPSINPAAAEDGGNEVDENCDGEIDSTCGSHSPVIEIAGATFDPSYDFGSTTASAMLIELAYTDLDGDIGTVEIELWIDTTVDGAVDTTGSANASFGPIEGSDDSTCDVAENGILLALGADNLVGDHPSAEVAVRVMDHAGHWSDIAIGEVPLE